ncbi:MAG: TRAP transporter small permease [Bacillota bacterium]|nr:TRAP transporter small permease [Bacillota bacterium]
MKKLLWKINELIFRIELFLGVSVMTSIVFIVFLQVFNRFILKQPLSWSEELARYLFIILVFIGLSVATKTRGHFGVEFLFDKLNATGQKIARVISDLLIIVFIGVIFERSFILINSAMYQKSAAMGLTVGYIYYTIPVFAAFAIIHVVTNIVEEVTGGNKL